VTKVVHQFCGEFDPEAALTAMRQSENWEWKQFRFLRQDDTVMDDAEIVEHWQKKGEVARSRGTLMHWHIEMCLNGAQIEEPHSPEFFQFLRLHDELNLKPFRTELSLYHTGLDVAGQIDCLCVGSAGLEIWDWKRSKQIQTDSFRQMLPPLHHLPDSNFWHYALQLNIYRYFLESEYDMPISRMCLGVFHPDRTDPLCVEIPRMEAEIAMIVAHENYLIGFVESPSSAQDQTKPKPIRSAHTCKSSSSMTLRRTRRRRKRRSRRSWRPSRS
jgi:hypothetical protein